MRVVIRLLDVAMSEVSDLRLADPDRLEAIWADIRGFESLQGLVFFGSGDRLEKLKNARDVVAGFAGNDPGIYSFADTDDLLHDEPKREWQLGLRPGFLQITGDLHGAVSDVARYARELPALDAALIKHLGRARLDGPFSAADAVDEEIDPDRSSGYGRLATSAVVDVLAVTAPMTGVEAGLVHALATDRLPKGVVRSRAHGLEVIEWGDLEREPVEAIVARRRDWLEPHLPATPASGSVVGDLEIYISATESAAGLTKYDPSRNIGVKAIVPSGESDIPGLLRDLERLLSRGETKDGKPLSDIVLIVPTRADALRLRAESQEHGLSTVVFVGDDKKLWMPMGDES